MTKHWALAVPGAVLAAALAACGGGGSDTGDALGAADISSGSISAFGSVVVNGTRFDVDAADIRVNGQPATQDDLDVGYVVRVEGDLDDGVADSVRFDADLVGEVDANAIAAGESVGTLTVMQQTVRITATTVIEDVTSADAIAALDRVLVSGFPDTDPDTPEDLVATHVQVLGGAGTDQVVGTVTARGRISFAIDELVIDWPDPPGSGERVLVRGDYDPGIPRFTADSVAEVADLADDDTGIELEGIVDDFNSPNDFTVGGIPVDASGAFIVNGPVAEDAEVEVEGRFSSGFLLAERVEVGLEDNVEIVAQVADVDPSAVTVGFLTAGSGVLVTAAVNSGTRLRDDRDGKKDFSIADLAVGDWVELDAFEDGDADRTDDITALKLERIAAQTTVSVEGPVDEVRPMLVEVVILGIEFDTGATGFDLTTIDVGDIVEVEFAPSSGFMEPISVSNIEKQN